MARNSGNSPTMPALWVRLTIFSMWQRIPGDEVCALPKPAGGFQRVDVLRVPPFGFISRTMQLAMVTAAERYGEFIADLAADGQLLREAQMMRVRWFPPANETGLHGYEFQVLFITMATWLL